MVLVASFDERANGFVSEGRVYRLGPDRSISLESEVARFLWDIGSSDSLISDEIYKKLDFVTFSTGSVTLGIGGMAPSVECAAVFAIPDASNKAVWIRSMLVGTFRRENVPGIDAIIGLDIILKGRLVVEIISGRPTLTFTIPDS